MESCQYKRIFSKIWRPPDPAPELSSRARKFSDLFALVLSRSKHGRSSFNYAQDERIGFITAFMFSGTWWGLICTPSSILVQSGTPRLSGLEREGT